MSAIDEYRKAMEASGVPREPLAVYDSNSYRRVGLASTYREVMWPDKHPYDGHPDISGEKVLRALVAAFNAMLEQSATVQPSLAHHPLCYADAHHPDCKAPQPPVQHHPDCINHSAPTGCNCGAMVSGKRATNPTDAAP